MQEKYRHVAIAVSGEKCPVSLSTSVFELAVNGGNMLSVFYRSFCQVSFKPGRLEGHGRRYRRGEGVAWQGRTGHVKAGMLGHGRAWYHAGHDMAGRSMAGQAKAWQEKAGQGCRERQGVAGQGRMRYG